MKKCDEKIFQLEKLREKYDILSKICLVLLISAVLWSGVYYLTRNNECNSLKEKIESNLFYTISYKNNSFRKKNGASYCHDIVKDCSGFLSDYTCSYICYYTKEKIVVDALRLAWNKGTEMEVRKITTLMAEKNCRFKND